MSKEKKEVKAAPEKVAKQKVPSIGYLFSSLPHPVEVSYNGEAMMVPPRVRNMKVDNYKLLGAIPKGIVLKK